MWGHMSDYGGSGMGIGMLLLWGLLIFGAVMVFRCSRGSGACEKRGGEKTALDILNERYASGEIEREEFEQKKNDLSK